MSSRYRLRRGAIASIIGAASVTGLVFTATSRGGSAVAAEGPRATAMLTLVADDLATAQRRDVTTGPLFAGTLTARSHAVVRAEVGGAVLATFADRGVRVAAGALLLRLEDHALRDAHTSAVSDVQTDEDNVTLAKRRLTRAEALLAGGAISAEDAEDARHAFVTAESRLTASLARVSAASDALGRTIVRAPFAGVVSARPVRVGDIVTPGTTLIEVMDPSTMYVEAMMPAAHAGAVTVGTAVTFAVTGYAGRTFTGRVERVNPAADAATRQVPVFVSIDNADGQLVAGLFAEGHIAPNDEPALFVPDGAVERTNEAAMVVRFAGGRIERRPVVTGREDADGALVEIRSGLAAGDTVVIGASRAIPTGTPARVADQKTVTPTTR